MAELLITSSLDPVQEGQVFLKGLPRHVTIWQYFQLPDSYLDALTSTVGEVVEGFSPLEIIGAKRAMFGEHNDTPVRRIKTIGAGATLYALHAVLGAVIEQHEGTIASPEWAYDGFNPRVTYVEGRALRKGEREILTSVELIEKTADKEKVVRNMWHLGEAV